MKNKIQIDPDYIVVGGINAFLIVQSITKKDYNVYNCKNGKRVLPYGRWEKFELEKNGIILTTTLPTIPEKIKKEGIGNTIKCYLNFHTEKCLLSCNCNYGKGWKTYTSEFTDVEIIGDCTCVKYIMLDRKRIAEWIASEREDFERLMHITEWFNAEGKSLARIEKERNEEYFKIYKDEELCICETATEVEVVKDLSTDNPVGLSITYEMDGIQKMYLPF